MADVSATQLTEELLKQYEAWLTNNCVSNNSISTYNRSLHAIYQRAVNGLPSMPDPFANVYRGVADTVKRALSSSEIHLVATFDIRSALIEARRKEGKKPSGKRFDNTLEKLTFVRDLFIFSFCMRGMNFIDMAYLCKGNVSNDTISYCRSKTRKWQSVTIEEEMRDIMDRHPADGIYQFPILKSAGSEKELYKTYRSALSHFNKSLAALGKLMGLQLTSYVSRHSWADIAYEQEGIYFASEGLGHSSIRTTQIYINSINSNRLTEGNHKLIKNVLRKNED